MDGIKEWNRQILLYARRDNYFTPTEIDPDVTIKSYRRGVDVPQCPFASDLACYSVDTRNWPHLGRGVIWIPVPAPEDRLWQNDLETVEERPGALRYLPQVMMHELGHVAGIGEMGGTLGPEVKPLVALMTLYIPKALVPTPSFQDVRGFLLADEEHTHQ